MLNPEPEPDPVPVPPIALTLTLETYASTWPGKALNEDHVTTMISENKRNDKTEIADTVEQQYFGEVVKKGINTDASKEYSIAKETVRFAYNGTLQNMHTLLKSNFFI